MTNLYLLSQEENDGYDTFDSCVVVAETEEQAKRIHPRKIKFNEDTLEWAEKEKVIVDWATHISHVKCQLIGRAINLENGTVVIASFNAG